MGPSTFDDALRALEPRYEGRGRNRVAVPYRWSIYKPVDARDVEPFEAWLMHLAHTGDLAAPVQSMIEEWRSSRSLYDQLAAYQYLLDACGADGADGAHPAVAAALGAPGRATDLLRIGAAILNDMLQRIDQVTDRVEQLERRERDE